MDKLDKAKIALRKYILSNKDKVKKVLDEMRKKSTGIPVKKLNGDGVEMKRYRTDSEHGIEEDETGDLVKYEDAMELIAELKKYQKPSITSIKEYYKEWHPFYVAGGRYKKDVENLVIKFVTSARLSKESTDLDG